MQAKLDPPKRNRKKSPDSNGERVCSRCKII